MPKLVTLGLVQRLLAPGSRVTVRYPDGVTTTRIVVAHVGHQVRGRAWVVTKTTVLDGPKAGTRYALDWRTVGHATLDADTGVVALYSTYDGGRRACTLQVVPSSKERPCVKPAAARDRV